MNMDDIGFAFWLSPDWSGGENLRDEGTIPFWMIEPLSLTISSNASPTTTKKDRNLPTDIDKMAQRFAFETVNWKPRLACRLLGRHFSVTTSVYNAERGEYHIHAKCCKISGFLYSKS